LSPEVWDAVANGTTGVGALLGVAWLINAGFLYLKREYLREVERADAAEARADKYENLLLKSRNVVSEAVSSTEEFADRVIELAREYEGKTP